MNKHKISMIVAADRNNSIGYDNKMPWHLPNDFKYFKEKTLGHTIIMGRLTMESIGSPLPKRRNIVLSRNKNHVTTGFEHTESIEEALEMLESEEEVFVIGGGIIYEKFLPIATKVYKTVVDTELQNSDTWFPKLNTDEWEIESSIPNEIDDQHKYKYYFNIYNRITKA